MIYHWSVLFLLFFTMSFHHWLLVFLFHFVCFIFVSIFICVSNVLKKQGQNISHKTKIMRYKIRIRKIKENGTRQVKLRSDHKSNYGRSLNLTNEGFSSQSQVMGIFSPVSELTFCLSLMFSSNSSILSCFFGGQGSILQI